MMGGYGGFGILGGLLSFLLIIVLLAVLALLAYWLWRKYGGSIVAGLETPPLANKQPSAREILDTRYARGELTREEYQTMVEDLSKS